MTTLQQMTEGQNNAHVVFNEVAESLSSSGIFSKRHEATSGLVFGFYGGLYNGNTKSDGTVTLTNASDNYVVVLRSSGVVSTSTTNTNSLDPIYAKLYKATCAGGVVTALVDQRWDANGLLFTGGSGTVGDMLLASTQTVTGAKTFGSAGAVGKLKVAGTTSGSITLDAEAVAGSNTLTLPAATDTLVGKATTDTLTNKTLTSPTLSAPVLGTPASGTLTNCTGLPIGGSVANTVTALSTSGTVNIDCSLGDYFTLAASGNVTSITFSNLPGSGKGASKWIQFVQDSTPRTVAWPASFKWAGGVAGAVSTGSGAIDELAITTVDNGTTWKATLAKAFA